ncbi:hypothetical protein Y032_0170g237 [Ancylostoma ceylanicum]|uniref:Uncharacterized protein n=1 Tax=Ancylostoma ceylanicum TaxID=53326 RepID=A0A016SVI8_9BILA|nr:hypothetical protein Y032_0170g237 [Ancylostoma ceylanicum]
MRNWQRLALVVLSLSLVNGCFLNSCPYRRYGRTLRCASCAPSREGICLGDGQCCTHTGCFPSEDCGTGASCPENFCRFDGYPGICIAKLLCCTSSQCIRSMQCA